MALQLGRERLGSQAQVCLSPKQMLCAPPSKAHGLRGRPATVWRAPQRHFPKPCRVLASPPGHFSAVFLQPALEPLHGTGRHWSQRKECPVSPLEGGTSPASECPPPPQTQLSSKTEHFIDYRARTRRKTACVFEDIVGETVTALLVKEKIVVPSGSEDKITMLGFSESTPEHILLSHGT